MSDDDQRWGIFVDIEGFSKLWDQDNLGLQALSRLTRLVFSIGSEAFPDVPERLFAHQGGDAFYIASDNPEPSFDRCAAIAIVLMRGMLEAGFVARAALAAGPVGDYAGCRPPEVRAAAFRDDDAGLIRMGEGRLTLQPVLGAGIINAVGLDKQVKLKGSLVIIAQGACERLSGGFISRPIEGYPEIMALDWIHSTSPVIARIVGTIGCARGGAPALETQLREYVARHCMKPEWIEPTFRFCGLR